jgi:hypothetical protein
MPPTPEPDPVAVGRGEGGLPLEVLEKVCCCAKAGTPAAHSSAASSAGAIANVRPARFIGSSSLLSITGFRERFQLRPAVTW